MHSVNSWFFGTRLLTPGKRSLLRFNATPAILQSDNKPQKGCSVKIKKY